MAPGASMALCLPVCNVWTCRVDLPRGPAGFFCQLLTPLKQHLQALDHLSHTRQACRSGVVAVACPAAGYEI